MDVDRLKEINDVFGHAVGDALLQEIARRMHHAAGDAYLARLGGDEFAIIANAATQPGKAAVLAEKLLTSFADELIINGQQLRTGLSIGVTMFPDDGADADTLMANADAALYRAKAEGRGTFRFFEAEMDQRLRERRALHLDLQEALDHDELKLYFQPQARVKGDVVAFEALVRWQHPIRGPILPSTFVPLAEESGLIIPIGEWVLRRACREAASWREPLRVGVNLSPVQFRHGDIPILVHSILLETGLAPSRLELEVTEGVLIDDFPRTVSILRRLKALGVRIAMDDFGTGYSSLSYLQAFPFDKIKIDQRFISNLNHDVQSATIVRAVIGLARGLAIPVVAEGVESEDQLEFLAAERCDLVQGYLIGRPAPIEYYAEMAGRVRQTPAQVIPLRRQGAA
jgi:diguanylate cyclase (GGDEF)-like protein